MLIGIGIVALIIAVSVAATVWLFRPEQPVSGPVFVGQVGSGAIIAGLLVEGVPLRVAERALDRVRAELDGAGFYPFPVLGPDGYQLLPDEADMLRAEARPVTEPADPRFWAAQDVALLRMMSTATFGPAASITLPSGRVMTGAEFAMWAELEARS